MSDTDTKYVSVTPVLSSKYGFIDDVRDQVTSLVRFIIMSPGWSSSLWNSDVVSFRRISAEFESNRDKLVGELATAVHQILDKKFSDYTFDCDFSSSLYDSSQTEDNNDGRYTINFKILMTKNDITQSALVTGIVNVDKTNNDISIEYGNSLDTTTL